MHSLKIINASHANNMQKSMNTKIKILNCNADIRVYAYIYIYIWTKSYSEICTNVKELIGEKKIQIIL
jgi:hypothetical protein